MNRSGYIKTLIAAYLSAPGTPDHTGRSDWAIATALFNQHFPLETLLHAIRLASLRRQNSQNLPPISSLAYFRKVALRLTEEETHPAYIAYIASTYQRLLQNPSPNHQETAAQPPESRGS